ncbi:uncharacterized protein LOC135096492 [Scylla paramamosain]|uniref:uncharacterized protein LOC135096492 n=1 Tax=Scylla paramamosain TaxID=85552 RepID=UPI00308312D2
MEIADDVTTVVLHHHHSYYEVKLSFCSSEVLQAVKPYAAVERVCVTPCRHLFTNSSYSGTSRDFDIRVGVHQESALSPLLFITVMEEATKLARGDGPWELLYANDLVLTAESREEVTDMFNKWMEGMKQRGLKINMKKTKLMVTGNEARERIQSGKWPCLRNLRGAQNFVCPRCVQEEGGGDSGDDEDVELEVCWRRYNSSATWEISVSQPDAEIHGRSEVQDGSSSSEVAEMCGVEDLSVELRKRRLRWFGHVRRAEGGVLSDVEEVTVGGQRPVGRPKKKWRKCDGGYEFVGNRTYGTRSPVVESSHRPSNPTLMGKCGH